MGIGAKPERPACHASRPCGGGGLPIVNPATGDVLNTVAHAARTDLDEALAAAAEGFAAWRSVSAHDRAGSMRRAADLLRERAEDVARLMTLEQGKPLAEWRIETPSASRHRPAMWSSTSG